MTLPIPAADEETALRPGDARRRLVHVMTVPMSLVFVGGQARYMKARQFDVYAVSSPGAELDAFAASEGVCTHAVEMSRRITPVSDLIALFRLCRFFRHLRPDIVHAHTPKGGLLGTLAARLTGVPIRIYHIRGLPFVTASGARRILLRSTERLACAWATRVLCVSASVRDVAVSEHLCSTDKIAVLLRGSGNGVDAVSRFNPHRWEHQRSVTRAALGIEPDAPVAGFVGRIVRDKGILELVEAWRSLRVLCPRLHLLLVGFLEPHDPLPSGLESELRADPRVHLTGRQPNSAPFYAAMDLVVLPTHREGFPNVPLEAAAMRLPVVATRIPGCVDAVLDGVTGVLVPPGDVAALTEAVVAYVENPALRRSHGRAGRAHVLEHYLPVRIWEALHQQYLRLLERPEPATTPLSLRDNFTWTLAGNAVYAASQWAMLTAIAKLGRPELVGQFALALAITAPVMMLANLNLAIVQATDARRQYRFADYLSLRLVTSTGALLLVAAGLAMTGHGGEAALVILAVTIAKVVESGSDIYYGLFQQHGRMDIVARSLMARGPASLVTMAAAVYVSGSVLWGAVLLAAVWACVFLGYDYREGARLLRTRGDGMERIEVRWTPTIWRHLVQLTLPMGVVALVNALVPNIPRYFVGHVLGARELGIFAALAYIIVAGHGIMTALSSAIGPRLAASYQQGNRQAFLSLVLRSTALAAVAGLAMTIGAATVGSQVLTLVYTREYAAYQREFVVLMSAAGFIYMSHLLWTAATAARYFRSQSPLFLASIVLSTVACAWLVPRLGLLGAATAVFATGLVQFAGLTLIVAAAVRGCRADPIGESWNSGRYRAAGGAP